ncbi:MAG: hypothetical protein WBQ41_03450 [Solirubrobacterales bacterium]
MKAVGKMSLLELCVQRTGRHVAGARLAAFIVSWGRCRDDLGRSPTVEEYADWWKQPYATAYREQAEFREAFAPLKTPDPVLDHMASEGLGEVVDPDQLQPA